MANLIIDIGNTALKAARAHGETLKKTYRYQGERVKDFICSVIEQDRPDVMLISSVNALSSDDEKFYSSLCRKLIVLDKNHPEIINQKGIPSHIGYDRAASILAARYLFKNKGCTIFDFGTTLKIDFLDENGIYVGGNMAPGLMTRIKSLNRYSKSLPLIEIPGQHSVLGTDLLSSMESGVVTGMLFEIQGYIGLNPENIVIFTGGDAFYFAKRMKNSIFAIYNIVLKGLSLIADEYA